MFLLKQTVIINVLNDFLLRKIVGKFARGKKEIEYDKYFSWFLHVILYRLNFFVYVRNCTCFLQEWPIFVATVYRILNSSVSELVKYCCHKRMRIRLRRLWLQSC
jgi:hypothetical protein